VTDPLRPWRTTSPASGERLLQVDAVDSRYGLLQAVRGVTFDMAPGDTLALVGANGAGKTTLLRTIAGAHRPAAGRVVFDGADVTNTPSYRRVGLGIALVPEGRRLFPGLTVEENLRIAVVRGRPGRWDVDAVLEAFPLLRPLRRRLAANLSGGEQQATAIGRALMSNPRLLLLDEVSLGLSPIAVDSVYSSLEAVISEGTTVVIVEQDLARAMRVASRVMCMLEGRIVLADQADRLTQEQVTEAYFGLRRAGAERSP
jgi:branched-chain amino acid transport system ATP-binding protein